MLKKLQDLLFEDEEDDEEEETIEEPVAQIREEIAQPVTAVKEPEPVNEVQKPVVQEPVLKAEETVEVRPAMQRIDVTQPIPTVQSRPQTSRNESVFRETASKPSVSASSFDIKVDEKPAAAQKQQTKPKQKQAARPARTQNTRSGYQFQPVISPIFGVDEKDMDALKTTTTKITEAARAKTEANVSPIISPMYGVNQEDKPSSIQKTVRKSNQQAAILESPKARAAEDEIPEFSLDDILKVRDEEFANMPKASAADDTAPLFPDLNLWDDEPESAEDATIVIQKPGI